MTLIGHNNHALRLLSRFPRIRWVLTPTGDIS